MNKADLFTMALKNQQSVFKKCTNKIADYIWNHATVKDECIPYWDYDAPNIPDEPVDASAAAISASALIDLGTYLGEPYFKRGMQIIETLASDRCFA